jgi:hypothetical protein
MKDSNSKKDWGKGLGTLLSIWLGIFAAKQISKGLFGDIDAELKERREREIEEMKRRNEEINRQLEEEERLRRQREWLECEEQMRRAREAFDDYLRRRQEDYERELRGERGDEGHYFI